uniref:AlNc14C149G7457 protein n=1 Tax=Albugo laibachii Nc14 TaxID=890382 RepID=F0WLU4_9STRA|nr:AlNc14C149G7457 [Albugo laibachii Nc14]|eukprot:CCA22270.1 AlNc14C149G7457 [Albugo laibachii Nc14]
MEFHVLVSQLEEMFDERAYEVHGVTFKLLVALRIEAAYRHMPGSKECRAFLKTIPERLLHRMDQYSRVRLKSNAFLFMNMPGRYIYTARHQDDMTGHSKVISVELRDGSEVFETYELLIKELKELGVWLHSVSSLKSSDLKQWNLRMNIGGKSLYVESTQNIPFYEWKVVHKRDNRDCKKTDMLDDRVRDCQPVLYVGNTEDFRWIVTHLLEKYTGRALIIQGTDERDPDLAAGLADLISQGRLHIQKVVIPDFK